MPNTLVIGEATRRQIGGLFDLEDLGLQQLAGFGEPQRAWRVLGESEVVSRFEALRSAETPLVGREEEVELLLRRWEQAKSGEGRVVLISGEPGIGKSRLTAALSERIGSEPHTRLRYFCSPHHQDSALYPFIAQLERAAGFARDDTVEAKLGKLQALLTPGTRDDDDITLLSELLSLPSSAANLNLSPQRKREKLFEAMLNQLEAEAQHRPVLMVFEDAHWIDPTSRELLDLTVDRVRHLPVLLIVTFRPEFQPPWGWPRPCHEFGAQSARRTRGRSAGAKAGRQCCAHRRDRRRDRRAHRWGAAFCRGADQVGAGKRCAGRPGCYSAGSGIACRAVGAGDLACLADRTARPARRGRLLSAAVVVRQSSYFFKHALVQDAGYSTLLRARRQELHTRVAAVLERHFVDLVERQPELLAHHLTAAGNTERAVDQWLKAGQRAAAQARRILKRSAISSAVSRYWRRCPKDRLGTDGRSTCNWPAALAVHSQGICFRRGG